MVAGLGIKVVVLVLVFVVVVAAVAAVAFAKRMLALERASAAAAAPACLHRLQLAARQVCLHARQLRHVYRQLYHRQLAAATAAAAWPQVERELKGVASRRDLVAGDALVREAHRWTLDEVERRGQRVEPAGAGLMGGGHSRAALAAAEELLVGADKRGAADAGTPKHAAQHHRRWALQDIYSAAPSWLLDLNAHLRVRKRVEHKRLQRLLARRHARLGVQRNENHHALLGVLRVAVEDRNVLHRR
mmetsp:Transcript_3624/g.10171  ORF Transcript_3624/g.10171 Transcript_3624/m.10171 type:complete len:246 (+) Transcript_3624:738-1475(+)